MKLFAGRRRFVTVGCVVAAVSPARAAELEVTVACPDWTSEAAAQVEARIRTSFLTEGFEVQRVVVSCAAGASSVQVEGERGSLVRLVEGRSGVLEDDVVATARDALLALAQPPAEANSAAEATPAPAISTAPPAPPPVPNPRAEAPASPVPAREALPSKLALHWQAGPVLERWSTNWAAGGEAGVFASTRRTLGMGLAVGGRAAAGEPSSFAASEWNATARLRLRPAHAAGFQGELGLGASLLVANPTANVTADASTLLWTASLDFRVSRPFSLGPFALAVSLGVRAFSGRRDVRVNGQEQLAVPVLVPQAALWLAIPGD